MCNLSRHLSLPDQPSQVGASAEARQEQAQRRGVAPASRGADLCHGLHTPVLVHLCGFNRSL